jgi:predicted membrane-bound mannosyltransferase
MRSDNGMPRAVSILDGIVEKQYTANGAQVDVYVATIGGEEMLVIHKRLSKTTADPYSFTEEVQVIAMSKTGAPTVVATYAGSAVRVAAAANHIEISTLRYLTSTQSSEGKWHTRIVLKPNYADGVRMDETVTSGPRQVKQGAGMELIDTYSFPVGRGNVDTPDTSTKA